MIGRAVHAPVALLGQPVEPLVDWATGILKSREIEVTGAASLTRRRAWSLLVRIPTESGPMWAKANARAFAHEGPLLRLLARLRPGSVLEPLAVQEDHGWLLSPHGGDTAPDTDAEWSGLLRSYADLQQFLAPHIDDLIATGTPYLPPSRLGTVYRHFEPRVPGLGHRIEEAAAELAAYGRLSLEHNDVHTGNVFAGATPGTGRLFDWGDAVITHPFLSHRILHHPHRAAYFEHWRRVEPVSDTEIALAERLAPLIALHPWRTIDTSIPRFARFVEELLDELRATFR
ncbi:phosphotransferase family enzyme [Nocardia tenerifensis]|uniref:Phosphotransferase family enzyme n=1 Tax=Nocardia tenerifensis TaxID=228006 RepID=A0A318JWI7_9NOCA|nr:phosphotransferase [Nocardia tenerifensis]PXX62160.1 phosphotransferase family enzyme [Nocardia tenerifensis]